MASTTGSADQRHDDITGPAAAQPLVSIPKYLVENACTLFPFLDNGCLLHLNCPLTLRNGGAFGRLGLLQSIQIPFLIPDSRFQQGQCISDADPLILLLGHDGSSQV